MKAERVPEQPAFNLLKNDGINPQAENKQITKLFLTNGSEFDILPGSFRFYITAGDRPQPFVQVKALLPHVVSETVAANGRDSHRNVRFALHTLEFFPAHVSGVGYLADDAEEDQA